MPLHTSAVPQTDRDLTGDSLIQQLDRIDVGEFTAQVRPQPIVDPVRKPAITAVRDPAGKGVTVVGQVSPRGSRGADQRTDDLVTEVTQHVLGHRV